ncbi:uncharacterized protein G2W53_000427 [Senna tora]|uniref:Uncharacterized protein n=1 Tax=Senna tora TaxID=362788 RepID=A0A834XED2_9FABA|nr:uncharacterized protein G2W53_000427 [Senna tora]
MRRLGSKKVFIVLETAIVWDYVEEALIPTSMEAIESLNKVKLQHKYKKKPSPIEQNRAPPPLGLSMRGRALGCVRFILLSMGVDWTVVCG